MTADPRPGTLFGAAEPPEEREVYAPTVRVIVRPQRKLAEGKWWERRSEMLRCAREIQALLEGVSLPEGCEVLVEVDWQKPEGR